MAFYENQSDMFLQRADSCRKSAERLEALATGARQRGDEAKYQEYMDRSEAQRTMQRQNEEKAQQHAGKTWR